MLDDRCTHSILISFVVSNFTCVSMWNCSGITSPLTDGKSLEFTYLLFINVSTFHHIVLHYMHM